MDATFDNLESLQEDTGIPLYMWESNELGCTLHPNTAAPHHGSLPLRTAWPHDSNQQRLILQLAPSSEYAITVTRCQ